MDKLDKIKFIKSRTQPPLVGDDYYHMRKPWQKFGGVNSGICMKWCWFRDEFIITNVTDEEIEMALKEIEMSTKE